MEKSAERLKVLEKIKEYEKNQWWDRDVEDDPETIELLPNKVDYLNKKLSSKILTVFANWAGTRFFEKMLKKTFEGLGRIAWRQRSVHLGAFVHACK